MDMHQGIGDCQKYPRRPPYVGRSVALATAAGAQLHKQVQFLQFKEASHLPDSVILANCGMVEVGGDLEFIDCLVEVAIVVPGMPDYPLERIELPGPVVSQVPDSAASAAAEVLQHLKARYPKSCP